MDPALLTDSAFWDDPSPHAVGDPGDWCALPELKSHVLFQTSGSSGEPKWIALSKSAILVSAQAVNEHLGVTKESRWGLALPVNHVGGFGVLARAHAAGCGLAHFADVAPRWDPIRFQSWVSEEEISHSSLVPTQVHDLVVARLAAPSSLRAIVVGGGRLPAELGRAARELGWPILASYGMTEAASQIATQPLAALRHPYQVSPISLLPIWQARLSPTGALTISGPALFSGTLVKTNAWNFVPRCSDWYETSDRVYLEDRQITPLGRVDTLVKVLGELIDPESIEREVVALAAGTVLPGELIIVAVPDQRMEHALQPVIDPRLDPIAVQTLIDSYHLSCPGHSRLRPVMRLDPFPRSSLGKPMRAEIARRIAGRF